MDNARKYNQQLKTVVKKKNKTTDTDDGEKNSRTNCTSICHQRSGQNGCRHKPVPACVPSRGKARRQKKRPGNSRTQTESTGLYIQTKWTTVSRQNRQQFHKKPQAATVANRTTVGDGESRQFHQSASLQKERQEEGSRPSVVRLGKLGLGEKAEAQAAPTTRKGNQLDGSHLANSR